RPDHPAPVGARGRRGDRRGVRRRPRDRPLARQRPAALHGRRRPGVADVDDRAGVRRLRPRLGRAARRRRDPLEREPGRRRGRVLDAPACARPRRHDPRRRHRLAARARARGRGARAAARRSRERRVVPGRREGRLHARGRPTVGALERPSRPPAGPPAVLAPPRRSRETPHVAVTIDGTSLTLDDVLRVARGGEPVELDRGVAARVRRGREIVERALAGPEPVYGLTTGVGVRKRTAVARDEVDAFNRRLVLEHRVGQGPGAPEDVVRAQLLLVVNAFARGTAGVRVELVERLASQLNGGARPHVRLLGSVGMSDLPANADLAHHALDGFELGAKEGLALLNHDAFSTAYAALALADAERLLAALDAAAALDLEALAGNVAVVDDRFRELLAGSYLWQEGAARNLQDPLSFRCAPRVHAAARETLAFVRSRVERELNASQENPFVDLDAGRVVGSAGFDVVGLSAALDFARIAFSFVVTAASERAIKLLQAPVTGLPEGLAVEVGL